MMLRQEVDFAVDKGSFPFTDKNNQWLTSYVPWLSRENET